jgi:hypothetical protein
LERNKQLSDELDHSLADRHNWGEPLSYVDLLAHPAVQARIAKLIVHSALKRPRRGRRPQPHPRGV